MKKTTFTMTVSDYNQLIGLLESIKNNSFKISNNLYSSFQSKLKAIDNFFNSHDFELIADVDFINNYTLNDTIILDGEEYTLSLNAGVADISVFSPKGSIIYGLSKDTELNI